MPLPLLLPLLGLGASALGGFFGSKSKQAQTSTTTPTLDPAYGPLQSLILQNVTKRLSSPTGLPEGYEAGGIKNINNVYDLVNQNLQNSLTSRGLARSPVAGVADEALQTRRAGDIGTFQTSLPLVARNLQDQDLGFATSLLGYGRGSTTTGTGAVSAGGGIGGASTNLAGLLGYLLATGAFGKGGGNGLPGYNAGPF